MQQMKEHSQKLTPYLFQNEVALYFDVVLYFLRDEKMRLTSSFGTSIS